MKSFVILQRAFVSLLCDSPQVLESSRWSRSDSHRPTNKHEDAHTHTHTPQTYTHSLIFTGSFVPFFLMRIHLPCDTYGDDNVIFGNLSSSTFLLVGNVDAKRSLALTQHMPCLQTVQMEIFHNSILILCILSLGSRSLDFSTEQMHRTCRSFGATFI